MKTTITPSPSTSPAIIRAAALSIALLASPAAFASNMYWDSDGNPATGTPVQNTAGSGTWDTTSALWNLNGNSATDQTWNATAFDNAYFGGADGEYAITLATSSTIGGLQFNASGYTLSAASAYKLTTNSNLTVMLAAGKTATIGSNVTVENTNTNNGGTLNLTGSSSTSKLIIDNGASVRATANGGSVIYIGSVSTTAGSALGSTVQVNTGGLISGGNSIAVNGVLKVEGGNVNTGSTAALVIGNFASTSSVAALTIDSGTVTVGSTGLRFGPSTGTLTAGGTLNLNGGTLLTGKIFSGGSNTTSVVNFNSGTVKATGNNTTDFFGSTINSAVVQQGGAVFDTNSYTVTVAKGLTHDTNVTKDGGLTKKSAGTLNLTGNNTYNGKTVIEAGTLALGSTASIASSDTIVAGSIAGSDGNFNVASVSGGYHLASGQTLKGFGTVTGAVTVDSGATIGAGNDTAGTLTALNDVTFTSGATLSIRLGVTALNDNDQLATNSSSAVNIALNGVSLNLTLGANYSFDANKLFLIVNNVNSSSLITGAFAQGSQITVGGEKFNVLYGADFDASGSFVSVTGGNDIALQAVPEPATWAMLLGGFGILGCFQKMRRARISA